MSFGVCMLHRKIFCVRKKVRVFRRVLITFLFAHIAQYVFMRSATSYDTKLNPHELLLSGYALCVVMPPECSTASSFFFLLDFPTSMCDNFFSSS